MANHLGKPGVCAAPADGKLERVGEGVKRKELIWKSTFIYRPLIVIDVGSNSEMSAPKSRILYFERKAESLNGPARIGRGIFSKTGRTIEYKGQKFQKAKGGYKWNHFDVETGDEYWISGPRKDGQDRLYPQSSRPVEIDEDVREEYWTEIRGRPLAAKETA